jgi:hypothetical protein
MPNIIKPKRSTVAAKVPTTSDIVNGEIAINSTDKKIYTNAGGTITQVGAGALTALSDVVITSPTNGQSLSYNGTNWVNATGAGSGTVTSVGITPGTGVTVSNSPITTSGNIAVGLSTKLTAIENLSGAGFITQNGSGAIAGRTIQAGTGISVAHGNGSSQDPVITNSGVTSAVAGTGITVSGATGAVTISNSGVTSVSGTSPVVSSGGATPAISLASGYGDTQNPYASKTANNFLAAPNGTAGAPTFRAIVAADIPTLNQNTTGTASNVTGTVAIANGGTGATSAATALSNLGAYPASNPNGYTSNTGTVTSVSGTGTASGLSLSGTVTTSGNITLSGTVNSLAAGTYGISISGNAATATSATSATTATTATTANALNTANSYTVAGLTVGNSGSSTITMVDTDEGNRLIHCNSNRIGFLTQAGNWGSYCNDDGSWSTDVRLYAPGWTTTGRNYSNEWIQFDNHTGIYSPLNAAHFYPNPNTYGSWRCDGSRNGWQGIEFAAQATLMMNDDNYGFHRNIGGGWRFYNSGGNGYFPGQVQAGWSDKRLKENFRPMTTEALDIVNQLQTYRFNWNEKVAEMKLPIEVGSEEVGCVAQEVQAVFPDAVAINKSANIANPDGTETQTDYLTINYNKLTPLLIQSVNELTKQINELRAEVAKLKGQK